VDFFLIAIGSIVVLGVIAVLASWGSKDEPIVEGHDCSSCSSHDDGSCKIACLLEEKKNREGNKNG
jgi:hypothetical protein